MELGVGAGVTQGWGWGQGQGPGPGSGWSILSAYTFGAEIGAQHILQPARRVDVHHGGGALLDNVRIRVHQLGCGRHGLTAHASGSGWAKCGALAGYPRQLGGVLHWARIRQRGGYPRSYATVRVLGGARGRGNAAALRVANALIFFCGWAIHAGGRGGAGCKAGRRAGDCSLAPGRRCARRGSRVTAWPQSRPPPFGQRAPFSSAWRVKASRCRGGIILKEFWVETAYWKGLR